MQPLNIIKYHFGHFGTRLWIPLILIMSLSQTACTTLDKVVCTGTGTCMASGNYSGTAAQWVSPLPQSIVTSNGTYVITRSQSTGAINTINQVSRGK